MEIGQIGEGQALTVLSEINSPEIFRKGGMQSIIDAISNEVIGNVADVSTASGRKEIAANAYRVARAKTLLDGLGKKLADDLNEQLKPINAERKLARDSLEELKKQVRQPLTDWETYQAKIKEAKEAAEAAEKLAFKIAADHEIAILINKEHDRNLSEKLEAARKIQAEHDDNLKKKRQNMRQWRESYVRNIEQASRLSGRSWPQKVPNQTEFRH
tara:strand:- start:328 stop:972 length:645 start_codon:yes stop_codon:yes gene_type:complete